MSLLKQLAGNIAFEALPDEDKAALAAVPPGGARVELFNLWTPPMIEEEIPLSQEDLDAGVTVPRTRSVDGEALAAAKASPLYRLVEAVHEQAPNAVASLTFGNDYARVQFHIGDKVTDEYDAFDRQGRCDPFDPEAEAARVVAQITEG